MTKQIRHHQLTMHEACERDKHEPKWRQRLAAIDLNDPASSANRLCLRFNTITRSSKTRRWSISTTTATMISLPACIDDGHDDGLSAYMPFARTRV